MRNCNAVGINQVLLQVYCCKCKADDIIMVMSDGVHDNLHPGMLNVSPRGLKINYDTWQLAQENTIDVETVASNFRVELLKEIILKSNINEYNTRCDYEILARNHKVFARVYANQSRKETTKRLRSLSW